MPASFYVGDVLIQNGSAISTAGLPSSSTSVAGIVQLNDTTSSTSTTQAATANAVKTAYDLATSAGAAATATTLGTVYGRDDAARDSLGAGQNALAAATGAATLNTAVGRSTFCALTTGVRNTAIGATTGRALTTGGRNTLVGAAVGCALTTTSENTFIGHNTGGASTGSQNTFVGSAAGDLTVATSCGVAIGWNALGAAATQSGTTAVGACALNALTTGACNVALGFQAGVGLTTGATNTLIGYTAGLDITTGSSNTIIGDISGTAALANNLILAAGTTIKLQVNENGAVSFDGTNFGTSGQTLQSNGTAAVPTWVAPIWQNLTPLTTTSTASTTLLSISATAFRGGVINLSVSDATSGNFHTDTLQFVNDGGFTNLQTIGGAHIGSNPYGVSVAQVGANIVVSVNSASTNSTKYVGNYMTFAV